MSAILRSLYAHTCSAPLPARAARASNTSPSCRSTSGPKPAGSHCSTWRALLQQPVSMQFDCSTRPALRAAPRRPSFLPHWNCSLTFPYTLHREWRISIENTKKSCCCGATLKIPPMIMTLTTFLTNYMDLVVRIYWALQERGQASYQQLVGRDACWRRFSGFTG